VELETLRTRKEMVSAQAHVLAEAMSNARINIVGGDGQFFERFINAVSFGQSVDGALEQSQALRALVSELTQPGSDGSSLAAALEQLAPLVAGAGRAKPVHGEIVGSGKPPSRL
jgi:hypothetical protein